MIHLKDKGPLFIILYDMYVPCAAVSAARADPGRITMLLKVVCPLPCRFTLIFVMGSKSPVEVTTEMVGCWWILSVMTTKNSEVGISGQDDHSIKHCCSYLVEKIKQIKIFVRLLITIQLFQQIAQKIFR